MPTNRPTPIRTQAFVLRRTNYGETDRILNLLTPTGKQSVIAKGVRKEKSRLAGGIELFCLSDVVIHPGKSDLGTLTSSKMLKYYTNITTDLSTLELASQILKVLGRASEQVTTSTHFDLLSQTLTALDNQTSHELVSAWFWLNFTRTSGEEPNLYFDSTGAKLQADQTYSWDELESALRPDPHGRVGADEIKFLRLLLSSNLTLAARVKNSATLLDHTANIVRTLSARA